MGNLFHGSVIANIHTIKAESTLHGTDNTKVVYLTDNLPYSLFYIWDSSHNIERSKHVTAWIKDGIVCMDGTTDEVVTKYLKECQ